jgi:hypothetical protein
MTGLTIASSTNAGYYLSNTTFSPVTVLAGVTITDASFAALSSGLNIYWTIINSGTLAGTGTGTDSQGIWLYKTGGAITNTTGGSISGYYVGVSVSNSGTVVNEGQIVTTETVGARLTVGGATYIPTSAGVLLGGGGVSNASGGSITGYYVGVSISNSGTVVNDGKIVTTGTAGSGFIYSSGAFTATSAGVLLGGGGVSNAGTGTIFGYFEGVAIGGGGSVVNAGTIVAGSYSDGFGVVLTAGGSVTNAQDGVIVGDYVGIRAFGAPASVLNQGYIAGKNGIGVILTVGGSVTNAHGGAIYGTQDGILTAGQPATVLNQGYIGGENGFGVGLAAGGMLSNISTGTVSGNIYGYRDGLVGYGTNPLTVINDAGAVIAGGHFGVYAGTGNVATVTNAGAIYGYRVAGAVLLDAGSIDNQPLGLIGGLDDGIFASGTAAVTITNAGGVFGYDFAGALLEAGGSVTNTGSFSGQFYGIDVNNAPGTVVNAGTISASVLYQTADTSFDSAGVQLNDGGVVTNSSGGIITSYWTGVQIFNALGSVMNAGTIVASVGSLSANTTFASVGVQLADGGSVTNTSGGTIASYSVGVQIFNAIGTVLNAGTISASATIQAADTIFGSAGVQLDDGGVVTNSSDGVIRSNWVGVQIYNAAGTVVNAGSISDAAYKNGAGVQLDDGGLVTNSAGAHISSKWMGVQIGGQGSDPGGTVINQGTIVAADALGDGAGVWIHGPGAITNTPGGLISGGAFGIVAYYQTTVINQGTIFGTEYAFDAINAGFADRIVDAPGAVFSGIVSGGNTLGSAVYSTLELASGSSTGTIVNIGTFVDFGLVALDAGATWSVGGSVAAGETVTFGGANSSLILASPSADAATMTGFVKSDTIALSGITDVTGLSFNGNTLIVSESGDAGLTLVFAAPVPLSYAVVGDATDLFVPCFLPGTHILTDHGEVLVEKLVVGDTIVTLSGRTRRLCWIGQGRTLATRGRRSAATPVIVRKGALADNLPHLDLHITKGHSLYFDGALIPVEFLVNHRSIVWDDRAQEVTVFHLELDAHDVLIANGVAAESYRDDGNRWLFQNANAGWDQPPKPPCAPVLTGGPLVDAIWQRILDRAGPRPGLPLTDDPDLHLLADGVRVDAVERQDHVLVFRLTGRPAAVRIASREAVPAELGLARDPRSLGVALRRIAVRQGTKFVVLKADDARLADGFHAYESAKDLRWTDGNAALPPETFARFTGGIEVVLHLAETTQYPNDGISSARAAA